MDHESQDPICGTCNCRAYLVKVYKATPENSPFGNPCPCDDDGTEIIHTRSRSSTEGMAARPTSTKSCSDG